MCNAMHYWFCQIYLIKKKCLQFEQECNLVGWAPPALYSKGGSLSRRGVSVRQEVTSYRTYRDPLPPVNRMTDRCKNITFPQLRLRKVDTLDCMHRSVAHPGFAIKWQWSSERERGISKEGKGVPLVLTWIQKCITERFQCLISCLLLFFSLFQWWTEICNDTTHNARGTRWRKYTEMTKH